MVKAGLTADVGVEPLDKRGTRNDRRLTGRRSVHTAEPIPRHWTATASITITDITAVTCGRRKGRAGLVVAAPFCRLKYERMKI